MSDGPRRVLIVRLSSIGDVIHTIPAYMQLHRVWPETTFGWAVEPAALDLVATLPGIQHVHRVDTPALRRAPLRAPARILRLRRELRAAKYGLAVDFQGLLKSAVVARLSGAPVLGYDAADARESLAVHLYARTASPAPPGCHILRRNLHLAAAASGTPPADVVFPSLTTPEDRERVAAHLRREGVARFALLHPVANWDSKRYPPERWAEVGAGLRRETGLPILWVWGPGERAEVARIAAEAGPGNRPAPPTSLPELAALMQRAALFVGGDSAPLHLAIACGIPVVGLFGPTDPDRLGPLDPADEVVRAVLPCSHCHERICPLGTRECLERIPAGSIVEAATTRLRRASPTPA